MKLCSPLSVMKNNSTPKAVQSGLFTFSSFIKLTKLLQLTALLIVGSALSACGSDSSSSSSDTTAPEITLSGADSVELGQGRDYLEYGITITDNKDDDITEYTVDISAATANTCNDIILNESDDNDCVGDTFYVTYTATDSAGNVSDEVERTVSIVEARPFIFTYQTLEDGEEFTLAAVATDTYDFDFTVDWGDGEEETALTETTSHTYADAGTYTISISGDFPSFTVTSSGEVEQYLSIEQWGDIQWQNVEGFLTYATNVVGNATDTPDLRLVDSLAEFFYYAEAFNGDISLWQVGHITNLYRAFSHAHAFNQDIGNWDVSSVTTLEYTFSGTFIFDQDISNWDVGSVTNMEKTFSNATMFNQDISGWDVSQVEYFNNIFSSATAFDQDLSGWDFSSATDMSFMFWYGTLSTENYDKLLNSLVTQDVPTGQWFSGGYSVPSDASLDAVDTLTNDKGWAFYYNY